MNYKKLPETTKNIIDSKVEKTGKTKVKYKKVYKVKASKKSFFLKKV